MEVLSPYRVLFPDRCHWFHDIFHVSSLHMLFLHIFKHESSSDLTTQALLHYFL